jgi:hypothetical protein
MAMTGPSWVEWHLAGGRNPVARRKPFYAFWILDFGFWIDTTQGHKA